MDLNKLSTADKVIGASAILFLVALFMPWYGLGGGSNNGWDYFLTSIRPAFVRAHPAPTSAGSAPDQGSTVA